MQERINESQDKMNNSPSGNERPEDSDVVNEDVLQEFQFDNAEFSSLNAALDQLQGALDNLESRNAGIHDELLRLLQSNREVRRVMAEERTNSTIASASESETISGQSDTLLNRSTSVSCDTECKTSIPNQPLGFAAKEETTNTTVQSPPNSLESINLDECIESESQ